MNETNSTFEDVKTRLDEIVDAVNVDGISLDAALDLYEEAVKLGMQASTLLEEGIAAQPEDGEAAEVDESSNEAAGTEELEEDSDSAQGENNRDEDEIGIDLIESTDVEQESVTPEEGEDGNSQQQ